MTELKPCPSKNATSKDCFFGVQPFEVAIDKWNRGASE